MVDFELTGNYYLFTKTYLGDYARDNYILSKLSFTVGLRYDKSSDFGQWVNHL